MSGRSKQEIYDDFVDDGINPTDDMVREKYEEERDDRTERQKRGDYSEADDE